MESFRSTTAPMSPSLGQATSPWWALALWYDARCLVQACTDRSRFEGNHVYVDHSHVRPFEMLSQASHMGRSDRAYHHVSLPWPRFLGDKHHASHRQPRHHVCHRRWARLDTYPLLYRGVVGASPWLCLRCYHGWARLSRSNHARHPTMVIGKLRFQNHIACLRFVVRSS